MAAIGLLGHGRHVIVVQPGGAVFDDRVLPIFYGLLLVSAIVGWFRPLVGGVLAWFTLAGLVPFAWRQLEPWPAVMLILVFAVPAVTWTAIGVRGRASPPHPPSDVDDHQADQQMIAGLDRRRFLVTMAGAAVAVVTGSVLGRYVYDRIWGPTHPESDLADLPASPLSWAWCGAVTSTECDIRARPRHDFTSVELVIATDPDLNDVVDTIDTLEVYDRVARFAVEGLAPAATYWYTVTVDGELDRTRVGSFRTFPGDDRPLRLVFASCVRTGSNGSVFDAIRTEDPDVYVCLGDFHYGDVFVDDVDDYRQVFDVQLTRPAQAALYRSTPIAYVWDDHDYGPNDSNRDAPGRAAAMVAYREYVPHYDLDGPSSAIFQAFTIGTTRVLMTDARSARDPQSDLDSDDKTMLGDDQRRWLLAELERSSVDHDLVIWVNPVPWVDPAAAGADSWAGYDAERRAIADHIAGLGIDNLVMVSGDAHMVAIDDGTHTNYSNVDGPGFPLLHVAALDRPGSAKGGPYTFGPITGGGHYGVVEITPSATGTDVTLIARDWRGDDLLRHEASFPRRTNP